MMVIMCSKFRTYWSAHQFLQMMAQNQSNLQSERKTRSMPLPEWFVPDTPLHEVHRLKGTGEITYLTHNFFATHELADAFHEKYPSSVREHRIWSPTHLVSLRTTTHHASPAPYVTGISKHYFSRADI
jgi:hypothetical protein